VSLFLEIKWNFKSHYIKKKEKEKENTVQLEELINHVLQNRQGMVYEPERTLLRVLCSDETEFIADFVSQLIPTLSLCSSVGNLIKYAIFLAAKN